MTTISPTRVSMYDFLYQDTQPMVSLLADAAQLSLPQTRLALSSGLQAIISALLAYQQRYQGQAISKKLFTSSAVKELRHYNSMNFATIKATSYHRHDVADALFGDRARVTTASAYIAKHAKASTAQAQTLLTCLCVIVLRELAILADYSQLDNDEIDKWFALQPQFLAAERFAAVTEPIIKPSAIKDTGNEIPDNQEPVNNEDSLNKDVAQSSHNDSKASNQQATAKQEDHLLANEMNEPSTFDPLPPFDPYWYELTKFTPKNTAPAQDMQQATSNYLKVIGRSPENMQQGRHNDMLVFASMATIALPHQRWLLQLAKISDIYLSRNRLRITSEPTKPPTRPLVSLGLTDSNSDTTPTTTSEKPIEYDKPTPIWKNPVILIIIVVIGFLGALAALKYQKQKSNGAIPATEAVLEQDLAKEREQQDVAIVKIEDTEDADKEKPAKTKNKGTAAE